MSKRFRSFFRASLYIHHTTKYDYLIPQFVGVFFYSLIFSKFVKFSNNYIDNR